MPADPSDTGHFGIQGEGKKHFARYPLLDALIERRSRRFAPGMRLNGGPLAYESAKAPQPLSLEEEAGLAFSACGITGYALAEFPYQTGVMGASPPTAVRFAPSWRIRLTTWTWISMTVFTGPTS